MKNWVAAARVAFIALTALTIMGCGGGGGGGSNNPPPPPTATAPTITTQPASQTVGVGSPVSFTVAATGNGSLSYQWWSGTRELTGETQASLSFGFAAIPMSGSSYHCVVTNTLNGTSATATTVPATLTVIGPPSSPTLSGESAVLPGSTGHVVTTPAVDGFEYSWEVEGGTITAGQGTNEVTYSAGPIGHATVALTFSNIGGSAVARHRVVVAADLPLTTVFAQPEVHAGASGVLASGPPVSGQTYSWTIQDLTATVHAVGPTDASALEYDVDAATGTYRLSLEATDQASRNAIVTRDVAVVSDTFLKDPRDPQPRALHTATLLNDGRVLVAGGDGGVPDFAPLALTSQPGLQSKVLGTAELFDPATRTWAATASLSPRLGHTATLLNDGRVLVVGGESSATNLLASGELYDPTTRTWTDTGLMAIGRAFHTATLLKDGRVLVVGGVDLNGALTAVTIYDPAANTWTPASPLITARVMHTATRLRDGRVLVTGGRNASGMLASAEIYDPAANDWAPAAEMVSPLSGVGAVLLPSGKVLVLSTTAYTYDPVTNMWEAAAETGQARGTFATDAILLDDGHVLATGGALGEVGLYDPQSKDWARLDSRFGRFSTATLLNDGTVLEVGGTVGGDSLTSDSQSLGVASLFDAANDERTVLGSRAHAGAAAAVVELSDGRVLFAGGNDRRSPTGPTATAAADLFDPQTGQWTAAVTMATARAGHQAVVLDNARALVTGGSNPFVGAFATAEQYDGALNAWTPAGAMSSPRYRHTATVLASGRVLAVGGSNSTVPCTCTTFQSSADLYDPTTNSWAATGALITARYDHSATLLPNGKVLVVGGFGGTPDTMQASGSVLTTAELYDPAAGTWSAAAPMGVARSKHNATLLASGLVLVAGGTDGTATHASAEVYDPTGDTWTPVATMSVARQSQSAQLLDDGTVLIMGGFNNASSTLFGVKSAERYDPVADQWLTPVPLVIDRQGFATARLPDGRVMIVGGAPNFAGVPEFYR